jgi:putative transposase
MNELATIVDITPFKLAQGQRVAYGGHVYECIERAATGKKLMRVDTKAETWVDNRRLVMMMTTGELKLAPHAATPPCRHDLQQREFSSLPEPVRNRAYMRRDYAEALIENARLGYPRKAKEVLESVFRHRIAVPENAGEWKPSESRAYVWKDIWEDCGRKGIQNLVLAESVRSPKGFRGGERLQKLLVQAIVAKYQTAQRHLVQTTHDEFVQLCYAEGIPPDDIPCDRTTRRAIKALSSYAVTKARRGQRAADLAHRSVGKLPATPLPGDVYEIDAHRLDIVVVDEQGFILGRLWITTAIDRCTRMIVGFHLHLEPPCSLTVAACIRNAIAPKLYMLHKWPHIGREWAPWGVPSLVIVDNALENKAQFLREAADEIGFAIHWAPPRTPEYKPYIERWHLTLTMQFERRIPGNTGSSPADRGDYDTAGLACATLEDIDELLHQWIVTVYNLTPHRGINDVPERLWVEKTSMFEVAPFDDIERLDVLLGHVVYRKIHPYGLELLGLRYGDLGANRCLEMITTRAGAADLGKVRVRFDPTDLSCIQVQDPVTRRYYRIDSLDPEYTDGMTLARHRVIRRAAAERTKGYITIHELCLARAELQRRIDEILGDPHATGREKAAILNGIGSKGSWGPFYRYAIDEYGGFKRKDQMQRTIVELLEGEYSYVDTDAPSSASAMPEPSVAPATDPAPRTALVPAPVATAASSVTHADDVKSKAAKLGMVLEGLDD